MDQEGHELSKVFILLSIKETIHGSCLLNCYLESQRLRKICILTTFHQHFLNNIYKLCLTFYIYPFKKKQKNQELPLKDILEILSYKYIVFFINLTLE